MANNTGLLRGNVVKLARCVLFDISYFDAGPIFKIEGRDTGSTTAASLLAYRLTNLGASGLLR